MPYARIAIMLPRFSRYGGVEQFGFRLAEALAAKGHRVDFICARQEVEAPQGVTVRRTGRPHGPRWVKMLVFACRAEALRLAGGYDCSISLGKTFNQDIMRVGGGPLPQFWRYSEKSYPEGPGRYWKQLKRRLSPANLLTRRLENRQYGKTGTIVAVSHFVKDLILEAAPGISPETVRIIYNKPDLTRYAPPTPEERDEARRRFAIDGETLAIGLATSNFQLKGTAPLIRSLAHLPKNCALYIAGGRNHGSYTALARSLGLADRVHFLGKVDDMPVWYKAMDVFTLPSFYDACSNAVLEALASGLPTLSSASNGSSYFLPPENVVADPGDSGEIARVLSHLVAQAEEHKKSGFRPLFTWPDTISSGLDDFVALVEAYLTAKTEADFSL